MRRHSPSYYSPPRRGYGGRARSPPRRKYGGGRRGTGQSLLVRNIPLNCRPEDLRIPFERYGRVRDVYLPRDYYSGNVSDTDYVACFEVSVHHDAQYHMNRQRFGGREITVVVASETRKRPDDMRHRSRLGGPSHHDGRRSSAYARSRSHSHSRSRSRSPYHQPASRTRHTSRSYTPPRRQSGYSASPRRTDRARSPRDYRDGRDGDHNRRSHSQGRDEDYNRRSHSQGRDEDHHRRAESPVHGGLDNGRAKKETYDDERRRSYSRSPRRSSLSPSVSRSRSADLSPGRSG